MMENNIKELTKAEEQVMHVIWKIGEGFANEIMSNFPEPKPAYNTVLTIVRILEKKGFVGHETFCKANRYYPLIYGSKAPGYVCSDEDFAEFIRAFCKIEINIEIIS